MAKIRFSPVLFFYSVLIVLSILLILFGSFAGDSLLLREVQNTGHTLLFIVITISLLAMFRHSGVMGNKITIWPYLAAVLLSFSIGLALEVGQLYSSRDPSFLDIARNVAGIVIGLCIYALVDTEHKTLWIKQGRVGQVIIVTLAFTVFVVRMVPITLLGTAYVQRNQSFPTVIDLQADWSRPFVRLQHARLIPLTDREGSSGGSHIASGINRSCLTLLPAEYPGVSLIEPYPDWSAFEVLTVVVYSPESEPIEMVLRIHDAYHNHAYSDRFNQSFRLVKGENRFRIPLKNIREAPDGRAMDMARIANVTLFSVNVKAELEVCPGRIHLE